MLPAGPLDADHDATLERGMRRIIGEQTGVVVGYVEQLYTFGDLARSRRPNEVRSIGVAYLVLTRETSTPAVWADWYHLLPWEDHRRVRPGLIDGIAERLARWAGDDRFRTERARIAFGLGETPWDPVRALERYELLYEAQLVPESFRDRGGIPPGGLPGGEPMAFDHRRVAATALARLRGKLTYRPVVFELLPATFRLSHLQRTVEALAGQRLHPANFRRLVERGGLVEGTGRMATTGGRPAELFRFRREVLFERPRPRVTSPG